MRATILLPLLLGLALSCTGEQFEPPPTSNEEGASPPATITPAPIEADHDNGRHGEAAPATQELTLPTAEQIDPRLPTTGIINTIIPAVGEDAAPPACGYTLFDDLGNGQAMFLPGSAELTEHAHEALRIAAAEILQNSPTATQNVAPYIHPVGHADPTPMLLPDGSDGNGELSRLRAVGVREALIALGIPPHWIAEPEGMGATKLIDEGTDPESLGRNRRVELLTAC